MPWVQMQSLHVDVAVEDKVEIEQVAIEKDESCEVDGVATCIEHVELKDG